MADLKKADWVQKVVKDPSAPPKVIMVTGYLGDADEEDEIRIYLQADLSQYVDVPEEAIHHTEEAEATQAPSGLHYIWLDRETEVKHEPIVEPQTERKQKFLEGRIQRNYMRSAAVNPGFTPPQGGGMRGGQQFAERRMGGQPQMRQPQAQPQFDGGQQFASFPVGCASVRFCPTFDPPCFDFNPPLPTVRPFCDSFVTLLCTTYYDSCYYDRPRPSPFITILGANCQ